MVSLPLTLIVTTCNRPRLLSDALESVASAHLTPPAISVIIVDDGDDVQAQRSAQSFGVEYRRTSSGSPGRARNFGLTLAETEYVAFLDDDDAINSGAFEAQVAALEKQPSLAAAFTQAVLVDEQLQDLGVVPMPAHGPDFERDWCYFMFHDVQVASAVFRTDMLRQIGGFDPRLRYCEDSHLLARLASQFGVIQVPGAKSIFRQRESDARDGAMRWRSFKDRRRARQLLAEEGLRLSLPERLRWNRQQRGFSAAIILHSAVLAAEDGNRRRAFDHLALAARVSPPHALLSFRALSRLGASLMRPPASNSQKSSKGTL